MKARFIFGFLAALTVAGDAVGGDMEAERAAQNFSSAADACLLDVRDKGIRYGSSRNCTTRLFETSLAYVKVPGIQAYYADGPVPRHAYLAQVAKVVAWTAAAVSNAKHCDDEPVLSLW